MEKILVHVCCGPCLVGSIQKLKNQKLTLLFSNSNIFPESEYKKRLKEAKKVSKIYDSTILNDNYNHKKWKDFIKGLENEPEGKKRCLKCFEYNLTNTAKKAKELKIKKFTTTLSISPYKNTKDLFNIARKIAKQYNLNFLNIDFSTEFKKSIELSKKHNLYRQKYCGCEFSKK